MGFLKRLFGSEKSDKPYVDKHGIYFYVQCANCGSRVRLRADKQHELNREAGGFVWHKTIIDSKCFRPMPAVIHLDSSYRVTNQEIENGRFLTKDEYEALENAAVSSSTDEIHTDE